MRDAGGATNKAVASTAQKVTRSVVYTPASRHEGRINDITEVNPEGGQVQHTPARLDQPYASMGPIKSVAL
jgi:hypothetical protein